MTDNNNFGSFLAGFLIGGIAGAIASLLLTPNTGNETRTMIKERAIELKDKTSVAAEDAYQKAEKVVGDASEKARSFIKSTADKAKDTIQGGPVVLEGDEPKPPKV